MQKSQESTSHSTNKDENHVTLKIDNVKQELNIKIITGDKKS